MLNNYSDIFDISQSTHYYSSKVSTYLSLKNSITSRFYNNIEKGDVVYLKLKPQSVSFKILNTYLQSIGATETKDITQSTKIIYDNSYLFGHLGLLYHHKTFYDDADALKYCKNNKEKIDKLVTEAHKYVNYNLVKQEIQKLKASSNIVVTDSESSFEVVIEHLKSPDKTANLLGYQLLVKTDWTNNILLLSYILSNYWYKIEPLKKGEEWSNFRTKWGNINKHDIYSASYMWNVIKELDETTFSKQINIIKKHENSIN